MQLAPSNQPVKTLVHRQLVNYLDKVSPSNGVRWEIFIMFSEYCRRGVCGYNTTRFGKTNSETMRKEMKQVVDRLVRDGLLVLVQHARPGVECNKYHFKLRGQVARKSLEAMDLLTAKKTRTKLETIASHLVQYKIGVYAWEVIDGNWSLARTKKWQAYNEANDFKVCVDLDASTDYGLLVKKALQAVVLPPCLIDDDFEGKDASKIVTRKDHWLVGWWRNLRINGVAVASYITKGRLYHRLTNAPRNVRKRFKMEYKGGVEDTVAVDMSCAFFTMIVSKMRDSDEKRRLIETIQNGDIYLMMNPDVDERDNTKKEFQKQCLFWEEMDTRPRPLWESLKSVAPEFCQLVLYMREMWEASGFAIQLMTVEGRIFVENALKKIGALDIPALPIHDGFIVPRSVASIVKGIVQQCAEAVLGFTPKIDDGLAKARLVV